MAKSLIYAAALKAFQIHRKETVFTQIDVFGDVAPWPLSFDFRQGVFTTNRLRAEPQIVLLFWQITRARNCNLRSKLAIESIFVKCGNGIRLKG